MLAEFENLLNPAIVAIHLGWRMARVRKAARRGELPGAVWIGTKLLFKPGEIREFLQAGGFPQLPQNPVLIRNPAAARSHSSAGRRRPARKAPDHLVEAAKKEEIVKRLPWMQPETSSIN
jgi:hypothetical protein